MKMFCIVWINKGKEYNIAGSTNLIKIIKRLKELRTNNPDQTLQLRSSDPLTFLEKVKLFWLYQTPFQSS